MIYFLIGGGFLNSNFYGVGDMDLFVIWFYKLIVEVVDYNLVLVIGIVIFIFSVVFFLFVYICINFYKEGSN